MDKNLFRLGTGLCLLYAFLLFMNYVQKANEAYFKAAQKKFISLPEEIDQAEQGDLLQVERVTNDTIFLGYKQY